MTRPIHFNAFEMNCVAHQSPGLWAHPRDRSWQYKDLDYWTDLAKILEKGIFDGIFIADVVGYYDVYKGNNHHAIREAAQIPVNDPLQLAAPIALATEHLGIGITASTSFEHPYTFARRLSTADHHTKGRVGWNIVTSYLESGAANISQGGLRKHENRYEVAEEYMEVLYKLWEGSWEEGAVVRDREKRIFAHPEKVHEIGHKGRFFEVPGYHLTEPSPQRTPLLYQAGASGPGKTFAAKHAECIFVAAPTKATLKAYVSEIRQRIAANGRDPRKVLIYNLVTVITDETDAKAQAKFRDYQNYASYDGALVFMSGWSGVDFGPIRAERSGAQSRDQCRSLDDRASDRRQPRLDHRPARAMGRDRRPWSGLRRLAEDGCRHPAGVGRGHRRRRLQPRLCPGARDLRRCGRLSGARAAEPRRLSQGL
jgi:FMN-dependent oxidoreductase (nitrilotriacetate monooxygenase family)